MSSSTIAICFLSNGTQNLLDETRCFHTPESALKAKIPRESLVLCPF